MSDVFAYECDLDRHLPSAERAAISVHYDGEHIVFGLAKGAADNREIYLTPDVAANLVHVVDTFTGAEAGAEPAPSVTATALACGVLIATLAGTVYGLVVGIGWLTALL